MFITPKKERLILASALVIVCAVELVSSGRLSLKESLTAYAEDEEPVPSPYNKVGIVHRKITGAEGKEKLTNEGLITPTRRKVDDRDSVGTKLQYSPSAHPVDNGPNGFISDPKSTTQKQFSLWELTKNTLLSLQQKGSTGFIGSPSTNAVNYSVRTTDQDRYGAKGVSLLGTLPLIPTKEIGKQQAGNNFLTTMKNELGEKRGNSYDNNKNNATTRSSSSTLNVRMRKIKPYLKDLEGQPQRTKKEIGINAGLQDLLWNTARALWSVNTEHFLPTFLHTKTGGKLSLIRDSIFKPITILSQFKSGVQEINNEKWKNLARLTTASGTGWGSPASEVFVVKLQPHNSRLLTLARYMLKLTKHTVITKYRLRRALLDLQFRALKKLIRILSSKNIGQKIATIKILANAALKGKKAFLRILTGRNKESSTAGPYSGKDNSINVDLTYSSLGNHYKDSGWISNSYSGPPPPPLPPVPQDSYLPQSAPPEAAPVHTNYYHNPENTPPLPLFPPSPSLSYEYLPPTSEPLIETPSYASVLKLMGINPSSPAYEDTNPTPKTPSFFFYPPPKPNDYDSNAELKYGDPSTTYTAPSISHYSPKGYDDGRKYKSPLIEKPAASYSYHYSNPSSPYHSDLSLSPSTSFSSYLSAIPKLHQDEQILNTKHKPFFQILEQTSKEPIPDPVTTTTPSSFRLKLLEAMSPPADEETES